MVRAPTQKSRVLAQAGAVLVLLGLVSDAWLSLPIPRFGVLVLGFAAVIFMAVAKQIRERDGIPIPREVVKGGSPIAALEVSCALIAGLAVTVVAALEISGGTQYVVRLAASATILIFVIVGVIYRFTNKRFETLMGTAA